MVMTSLGRMVTLFGVCFFLIGYVHGSAMMYMISLFCLIVVGIGVGFAWLSLRGIRCEREATGATVFSGDPLEGTVRLVESRPRWRLLEVFDQHINRITRHVTRRRMTLLTEGAGSAGAVVAGARQPLKRQGKHGRVLEVRDIMRFARRGHYHLGPLLIQGHDPFGLCSVSRVVPAEMDVIVYPRPLPIPEMVLLGAGGRQNTEVRPVDRAGESADFHGIRPYVQGDDLRRVHWKATAHTGKLAIKEFEYRFSGAVMVILDLQDGVHAGERDFSTLEMSITLAASLLNHVISAGNQAGMVATGAKLTSLPPESGQKHLHRALESLALAKDDGTVPIHTALLGGAVPLTRSGTVIVISPSVDQKLISALMALRGRAGQVLLVSLDAAGFLEAEKAQKKPRNPLLSLATSPIDLRGLRAPKTKTPPREAHATLIAAATAAGIDIYSISSAIPLHQALQGIRMRM